VSNGLPLNTVTLPEAAPVIRRRKPLVLISLSDQSAPKLTMPVLLK
jgi:hypothetical protein